MPEQCEEKDDRQRYAEHPEKKSATHGDTPDEVELPEDQLRGPDFVRAPFKIPPFKIPVWNPFVGRGVFLQQPGMETNVDKEHVKGAVDKAKGSIKKGVGKATGNERLRREGEVDKAKGDLHKAAGDVKDAAKRFTR